MSTRRYLITTSDERTWRFDRPVLFLGEWCRRYSRKHVWSKMDAVVAAPFGVAPGEMAQHIARVQSVAAALLSEIATTLNRLHGTAHSERYWNIVLGHWLQRYVSVAYNRFHTLKQVLGSYDICGTGVLETQGYSLATLDSGSFIWAANDDLWNHVLYARLLARCRNVVIETSTAPVIESRGFRQELDPSTKARSRIRQSLRSLASRLSPLLSRDSDAFIINSYLPVNVQAGLEFALGQFPQFWRSPSFASDEPHTETRMSLRLRLEEHEGFDQFVRWQLPEAIPTCYVESYRRLTRTAATQPWPQSPKFIFTSNLFDTNEIFKAWVGENVENGVPYYTGQHGNNYETHLLGGAACPERATADRFLTWGWSGDAGRAVPAFVFKTASDCGARRDPAGGLLLVEQLEPHLISPIDSEYAFGEFQREQFRFVEALPEHIRQALTVRLHAAHSFMRWSEEQRWADRNLDVLIETGAEPIKALMAASRLVMLSYDSTSMLEMFSLNVPMMCFWYGGLEHVVPDAKPYYELLRNAGILLDSPEAAAAAVANQWTDVDQWWQSANVQEARSVFGARYARRAHRPVRTLKRLLLAGTMTHAGRAP